MTPPLPQPPSYTDLWEITIPFLPPLIPAGTASFFKFQVALKRWSGGRRGRTQRAALTGEGATGERSQASAWYWGWRVSTLGPQGW